MPTGSRLLIYSHDSFGLGHLRRCRAIAHALVDRFDDLSVLILSGSPIIGSFDFKTRVDFVRIPGVIKLHDGAYTSLKLRLDVETTIGIRSSIIKHTADIFEPDLFIVDKEPLGLRGEAKPTLEMLRRRGTRCVLGLRDVMDDPETLDEEWHRKGVYPALPRLYDEIWVYGLPTIFDPIEELPLLERVAHKISFTGYIERERPVSRPEMLSGEVPDEPFILVTTGGGGDGAELIDWVISAYERDPSIPHSAVILFGPFLDLEQRWRFQERIASLPKLRGLTFVPQVEALFERAIGIVAMGGYNTFCEILTFEKPALVLPRTHPRREQYLRAIRAEKHGILRALPIDGERDPAVMSEALHVLPYQPVASAAVRHSMLRGLDRISELAAPWLAKVPDLAMLSRSA